MIQKASKNLSKIEHVEEWTTEVRGGTDFISLFYKLP